MCRQATTRIPISSERSKLKYRMMGKTGMYAEKWRMMRNESNKFQPIHLWQAEREVRREQEKETED